MGELPERGDADAGGWGVGRRVGGWTVGARRAMYAGEGAAGGEARLGSGRDGRSVARGVQSGGGGQGERKKKKKKKKKEKEEERKKKRKEKEKKIRAPGL